MPARSALECGREAAAFRANRIQSVTVIAPGHAEDRPKQQPCARTPKRLRCGLLREYLFEVAPTVNDP